MDYLCNAILPDQANGTSFDFEAAEGFSDEYGRPTVDLNCTCEIMTYGSPGGAYDITKDNNLDCYCDSTEGVDCSVGYGT